MNWDKHLMISEREAAKYPFLKDAVGLVEVLDVTLDDLLDPSYGKVLDRAEDRVSQAILTGETDSRLEDPPTELLSYAVANMFVTVLGEDFLSRRYALSEALRAEEILREEREPRVAKMARTEFEWTLNLVSESLDGRIYNFGLHFGDYLRNAAVFREPKWKLVNRMMKDGYVLLTQREAIRLLKEEIQRRIFSFVSVPAKINLPEPLRERTNRLAKVLSENRASITGEDLPSEVVMEALPPCISTAFEGLIAGKRLGHMERFALTSFLINVGMEIDDIVKVFVSVTDFDEEFTRYQIEHIAGLRGSRTRYTPPTCSTLRTHGVCVNPDRICGRIKHPLSYYRRKIWMFQRQEEERQEDVNPQISE